MNAPLLGKVSPCPVSGGNLDVHIPFEETAHLLAAIQRHASSNKLSISAIVLAPEFVQKLVSTDAAKELGSLTTKLTRREVWIRTTNIFTSNLLRPPVPAIEPRRSHGSVHQVGLRGESPRRGSPVDFVGVFAGSA